MRREPPSAQCGPYYVRLRGYFGLYRSAAFVFAPARSLDYARDDETKYRFARLAAGRGTPLPNRSFTVISTEAQQPEIIYVFRTFTNTKFDYYNYINFNDESEFNTFNSKCKELAFFDTQIQCNYGDKFITLSTCDYTSENARFVVIAKQIK